MYHLTEVKKKLYTCIKIFPNKVYSFDNRLINKNKTKLNSDKKPLSTDKGFHFAGYGNKM